MKMRLLLLLICSMVASPALAVCLPLTGEDQIWSNSSLRWVFVGEIHGSDETPMAFYDLVCDSLAHGKQVTVALERPSAEQPALEHLLIAKDVSAATQELLRQPGWSQATADGTASLDGRASKAMLRLLIALRQLRTSYPALAVFAFDVPYTGTGEGRDKAMGTALLSLREKRPQGLILVLTGNAHTFLSQQFGYNPAAMYLPFHEKLSLEVTSNGGQSWAWWNDGCGPREGGASATSGNRGREIVLDPHLAPYGKVDGILSLGVATTASPPAAGEITPLPPCRKRFISEHPDSRQ